VTTIAAEESRGPRRTGLRLLVLIPLLFAIVGGGIVWYFVQLRAYVPPTRGVLVGLGIVAISAITTLQLWRGARSAPILLVVSGACLMSAPYLAVPLDMVNAAGVDEPTSFLYAHAYQIVMATIAGLSIGGCVLARRWLRVSA
jgi:hypothetical protein